jgi:hypothetical protein
MSGPDRKKWLHHAVVCCRNNGALPEKNVLIQHDPCADSKRKEIVKEKEKSKGADFLCLEFKLMS